MTAVFVGALVVLVSVNSALGVLVGRWVAKRIDASDLRELAPRDG